MDKMFCYQCQEASKGIGCTIKGVCGKDDVTANRMDLLMFVMKGIAVVAEKLRANGTPATTANHFITEGLFSTITNANFDVNSISARVTEGLKLRNDLIGKAVAAGIALPKLEELSWNGNESEYESKSASVGVLRESNEDVRSLKELVIYGLKGMAAYAEHASKLGFEEEDIYAFIQHALAATTRTDISADELTALVLETGSFGVKTMALLDKANTTSYGNPEVTKVNIGVGKNPGILISGHDLKDMEELLAQTEGTGVDVYTHSEMLPANYYPAFKKYKHFVGNYGNAWWKQREEFESFNGPILFTTNCIVPPLSGASYKDKVYTTNAAGYPGFKHVPARKEGGTKDFSEIIEVAKKCAAPTEIEHGEIIGGFAHNQVMQLAGQVVDAVKSGAIKKFVVMAGCDGRMKTRDYYSDFATQLPKDNVILTAGCAKYRYNKLPLGDINGIPVYLMPDNVTTATR